VQARSILDFSRGRKGSRNAKAGEQCRGFWNPLTALPGAKPSGHSTRAGFDRFNQHSRLLNVKSSE
jgi:hypothetical protein